MRSRSAGGASFAALIVLAAMAALLPVAHARSGVCTPPEVRIGELPPEARDVLARIHRGGPFEYDRDGITFGNRERLLPSRPRGYYHEYTVRTPGERSRGARRIICGGPRDAPDVCFYTTDHYQSFRCISE
jgi:ribonuclease T1